MNRLILFNLALSLLLLMGCAKGKAIDEENPVAPDVRYVITLTNIPDVIVGIEGSRRTFNFQITVNTNDGLVVSEKAVALHIDAGPGELGVAEITTNPFGMAQTTYTTIIPNGNTLVRIMAECGGFRGSKEFHLISLPRPAVVELSTLNPNRIAVEGQNIQMDFTALLTDENGGAVPGITLKFDLVPIVEGGVTYGTLTNLEITDSDGLTRATFRSAGGFGRQKVACYVDEPDGYLAEVRDEVTMNIESLNDKIGSFTLQAEPDYLIVSSAQPESSSVAVNLLDPDRSGIPGITVDVTTDVGYIVGRAVTNDAGRANIQYIVEYHNLADTTLGANLLAVIPGTDWVAREFIILTPEGPGRTVLRLATDTRSILADNGRTVARLTASLTSRLGEPISGKPVIFTTTHGLAQSPVMTDVNGIARSVFTDIGLPSVDENGLPDSAIVRARVDELEAAAQVKIMILPWDEIHELSAPAPERPVVAGGVDSVQVFCHILNPAGELLGGSIVVHFEPTRGIVNPRLAVSRAGIAETWYYSPYIAGADPVTIWTLYNGVRFMTTAVVQVLPGPPSRGSTSAEGGPLVAGDSLHFATISALIMDAFDNPTPGVNVGFSTVLGRLQTNLSVTDAQGLAQTRLFAGNTAGLAIVTTSAETDAAPIIGAASVEIQTPAPGRIDCLMDNIQLAVGGQDETSSARITVRILYDNGLPVQEACPVIMEVLNDLPFPRSCYFNDDVALQRLVTQSSNGVATATITAGDSLGIRALRACTWAFETPEDTIEGFREFYIVPGEANTVQVNLNPLGFDNGAGTWLLEAWADARDSLGFPVAAGTEIEFRVDPNLATINPVGVVYRAGHRGLVIAGRAYTTLVYPSDHTFGNINIEARISTLRHGLKSDDLDVTLPLQQGELSLNASPGNWNFADGDTARITLVAELRDGHHIPINFGSVQFSPLRGALYWHNIESDQLERLQNNIRITGLNNNQNEEQPGQATAILVGRELEFFAAPENPEDPSDNIIDVRVEATLQGYRDVLANPVTIRFIRP